MKDAIMNNAITIEISPITGEVGTQEIDHHTLLLQVRLATIRAEIDHPTSHTTGRSTASLATGLPCQITIVVTDHVTNSLPIEIPIHDTHHVTKKEAMIAHLDRRIRLTAIHADTRLLPLLFGPASRLCVPMILLPFQRRCICRHQCQHHLTTRNRTAFVRPILVLN